jgi:hypothetical protein
VALGGIKGLKRVGKTSPSDSNAIFFYHKDIVYREFLEQGQTVNWHFTG